ncbi:hypothetical protein EVAR_28618_1 [Eumeta japonica]|uniref:Uncharacterized protein n=1 Tax=Eumeta variegata TaxID=151549 RepID=A0A4C1XS87_EUMVA|nr:hypothetical protein EVAR_28618_1 [Eumeta japonica]
MAKNFLLQEVRYARGDIEEGRNSTSLRAEGEGVYLLGTYGQLLGDKEFKEQRKLLFTSVFCGSSVVEPAHSRAAASLSRAWLYRSASKVPRLNELISTLALYHLEARPERGQRNRCGGKLVTLSTIRKRSFKASTVVALRRALALLCNNIVHYCAKRKLVCYVKRRALQAVTQPRGRDSARTLAHRYHLRCPGYRHKQSTSLTDLP